MGGRTVRTTLVAVALVLLGMTGCARTRSQCYCSSQCPAPSPVAAYKPCVISASGTAAKPAAAPVAPAAPAAPVAPVVIDQGSPYTTNSQFMPPAAPAPPTVATPAPPASRGDWPTIATPVSTPKVQPPAAPEHARPVTEVPATELPEPAKLPVRPSEPVPLQPKRPQVQTDAPPDANLGQTPEPEIASIIQTGAVSMETAPVAALPILFRPSTGAQTLTGVVESFRRTWRLRYAGVDVDDPHGGRVTLIGGRTLEQLQEGQRIRVRGILIPTADRGSAPAFDVQAIEVLD
jgi:hypothetical protein